MSAALSPSRRSRRVLLAVGLASSAFFLWLVLRDADLDLVWRALRGAELGLVLLAAVVIQVVYVAQGARWRLIADTLELTVRRFYALVLAGIGTNNVLPLTDRGHPPRALARDLGRDPERTGLRLGAPRPRL